MPIDILKAAKLTKKYLDMELETQPLPESSNFSGPLSIPHQVDILEKIISGAVTDDKAHRWFGWCQAALAANEIGDMNVYRVINAASNPEF